MAAARTGPQVQPIDLVVLTRKRKRTVAPETLEDVDRFLHAGNTHRRRIERDAEQVVVPLMITSTDADFQASTAHDIERSHLVGQHGRMAKVVVKDGRSHPERRRRERS